MKSAPTKYVLIGALALLLAGAAVLEFVHHGSDTHALICVDPTNKVEQAKALLQEHLMSHR
jgi:DNA repair ATPase RecN